MKTEQSGYAKWLLASLAALRNAGTLLNDARRLAAHGSMRTALALAILAEEEQAKSLFLLGYHWGLRDVTPQELLRLRQHPWKQEMLAVVSFVEDNMLPSISTVIEHLDTQAGIEVLVGGMAKTIRDIGLGKGVDLVARTVSDPNAVRELRKRAERRARQSGVKNQCLYVDVLIDGKTSQADPKPEEFEAISGGVSEKQQVYESLHRALTKYPEFDEAIKRFCEDYRRQTRSLTTRKRSMRISR